MAKIGFIGCGNMGGALAKAVSQADASNEIFLADLNTAMMNALAGTISAQPSDAQAIALECDCIFMGVKPQVLADCFAGIKDALANRETKPVIVSMAAGVAISDIKRMSGIDSVIRIMPNMPVSVGAGVVLACAENISDEQKSDFENAMSKVGIFDWLEEKYIDAASALSGCGPAFVYMFAQALADGAVACGLPRDKALLYAAGTLEGSARMILGSDKHPEKLKDEVCSPGGSTIMGVKALEDEGMRGAAISAVIAAYNRTKELGK
ncbi:MAG: pyrroline-5-carboxylate reductase [Clostridia bacterium]|nr:pyrroline-5-carboxylate reductase [Clostridia bacterium]